MRSINWRFLLGVGLVLMGILSLLQVVGILPTSGALAAYMAAALFLVLGAAFLWVLIADREKWWAAIPGIVLISLAALILWTQLMPARADLAGSIFLLGIGVSFWVVYLKARRNWWAIIPGGVMTTLAIMTAFLTIPNIYLAKADSDTVGFLSSSILFLGLAATFALVALLPTGEKRMNWPWIPAGVLLLIGIFFAFSQTSLISFIGPAVLILAGVFLVGRTLLRKGQVNNE